MGRCETILLTWIAALFFLGVALAAVNPDYLAASYVREDGVTEWMTVVFLLTCSGVSARRFITRAATRTLDFKHGTTLAMVSITCFIGALEEISWGQRLLGFQTPESLARVNLQGEATFHNIGVAGTSLNKIIAQAFTLVFLIYLLLVYPLYLRSLAVRGFIDKFGIPIPSSYQWAGYFVVVILVELYLGLVLGIGKRGELNEFAISGLVMLTILWPRNRTALDPDFPPGRDIGR